MRVDFYCEDNGNTPVLEWLIELSQSDAAQFDACRALIRRLIAEGHLLRAPRSKPLGDQRFELKTEVNGIQLRIFYFFHGQGIAIAAHHLAGKKTQKTPKRTLETLSKRKAAFQANPESHRRIADLDKLEGL